MSTRRNILVLGCGDSGVAAARLLRAEGADVLVVDGADTPALRKRAEVLGREGIEVRLGVGPDLPSSAFHLAVVSPGIPITSPWVQSLRARGVAVLPELEVGWSRRTCRVAAVTGSNGKSTAVKWLSEALTAAGLRAVPAGNYGPPISEIVMSQRSLDWIVLEVSSFQLEAVDAFRPDVGILLNVHPNHLDRHPDFYAYLRAKARLFAKAQPQDACLLHDSIATAVREIIGQPGQWMTFGSEPSSTYRFVEGRVYRSGTVLADLRGTWFDNHVLGQTGAAVVGALVACGVDPAFAEQSARSFQPLAHRMQCIADVGGVRFIDDSKATNLAAMAAALRMAGRPVRLIAGGLLKESDLASVKGVLKDTVRAVYLIGKASRAMAEAWSDTVRCVPCETVEEAVARAGADAASGEAVLLSPACASFDQFRDYKERGERFAQAVQHFLEQRDRTAHK